MFGVSNRSDLGGTASILTENHESRLNLSRDAKCPDFEKQRSCREVIDQKNSLNGKGGEWYLKYTESRHLAAFLSESRSLIFSCPLPASESRFSMCKVSESRFYVVRFSEKHMQLACTSWTIVGRYLCWSLRLSFVARVSDHKTRASAPRQVSNLTICHP